MSQIVLENFNLGGVAESKYQGGANSLAEIKGCDLYSEPGIIQASNSFVRENVVTGTAKIDAFIKKILVDSNGDVWYFSSENSTPSIWKNTSSTFDRFVSTDTGMSGLLGVSDAVEFYGFIFYFHADHIGYWKVGLLPVQGLASWKSITNTEHHTIAKKGFLYFSDGQTLKVITANNYTPAIGDFNNPATVIDFGAESLITAVGERGDVILIAVQKGKETYIYSYRFTGAETPTYMSDDKLPESRINSIVEADNMTYAIGTSGKIYQFDGYQYSPIKKISEKVTVNPKASAIYKGRVLVGAGKNGSNVYNYNATTGSNNKTLIISGSYNSAVKIGDGVKNTTKNCTGMIKSIDGSTLTVYDLKNGSTNYFESGDSIKIITDEEDSGIYSIGSYLANYPAVMCLEFATSRGYFNGIQIGAIAVKRGSYNETVYISWYDSTATGDNVYGVDVIGDDKLSGASFTTRVIKPDRTNLQNLRSSIGYDQLPSGTDIDMNYKKNSGAKTILPSTDISNRNIKEANSKISTATTLQFGVGLTTASNTTPKIDSIIIDYD